MKMETKDLTVSEETRENIKKRILFLERRNYNTKEFSVSDMTQKIKKIIEDEVNKNGD